MPQARCLPVALSLALLVGCVDGPGVSPPIPGTPDCAAPAGEALPQLPPVSLSDPASFYADDAMPMFELEIPDGTWEDLCDKGKAYADYLWDRSQDNDVPDVRQEYSRAHLTIQGEEFSDIGLRFRGRTTIYALFYDGVDPIPGALASCYERRLPRKPSLKISLDEFDEEYEIVGQQTFNLIAREGSDSAYLREVLAQRLTNLFGIEAPRAGHGRVCLDGSYEGLFSLVEEADTQRFLNQHFPGAEDGGYWKVEADGSQFWSDSWDESGGWVGDYEPKAGTDEADPGVLRDLLLVGNMVRDGGDDAAIGDAIDELIDVDQWLRQVAVEMSIPDYDGMFGNHKNHLLYDHPSGFRVVPYDRDLAFVDLVDYLGGVCPGDIRGGHPCWSTTREGPWLAKWLVEEREDDYLELVEEFVDDVFVEDELTSWILDRADAMRPWVAADRYYQSDSPACDFDPDCLFYTLPAWEYEIQTSLVEDVAERVAEVRRQLDGGAACENACEDR